MKKKLPTGKTNMDQLIQPRPTFTEKTLSSLLHQYGLKATSQRISILKALSTGAKKHLTVREIFEKILKTHPDIGFATVYRFLKTTTDKGITAELKMHNTPSRYELKSVTHHHHIICVQCGKIIEFKDIVMEESIKKVISKNQFLLTHHVIELYGKCHHCM